MQIGRKIARKHMLKVNPLGDGIREVVWIPVMPLQIRSIFLV